MPYKTVWGTLQGAAESGRLLKALRGIDVPFMDQSASCVLIASITSRNDIQRELLCTSNCDVSISQCPVGARVELHCPNTSATRRNTAINSTCERRMMPFWGTGSVHVRMGSSERAPRPGYLRVVLLVGMIVLRDEFYLYRSTIPIAGNRCCRSHRCRLPKTAISGRINDVIDRSSVIRADLRRHNLRAKPRRVDAQRGSTCLAA